MKKIIITIDGYSSCGKSTLAKALAADLNYVFIDSGAMYRAITLYFLRNHVDWNNSLEVINAIENITLVAAVKEVREFAIAEQRKMGKGKGIVMDGRDIGSTVFPKAELKIFLTADPAIRVERRFREMLEKNPNITIDEVKTNLEMRDYIDSNREFSPLRKAKDAVELDNTNLTIEDQLKIALKLAKEKIEG